MKHHFSRLFRQRLTGLTLLAGLAFVLFAHHPALARQRVSTASAPAFLPGEQDAEVKREVLRFLKEKPRRRSGERWLYLARHYREMGQPEESVDLIRQILRADPVEPDLKAQAQLLLAEVLVDRKEEDRAIRELERLLSWNPDREWVVKAKIERAKLLGRGLTRIEDLFKAYSRYFLNFPEQPEREEMRYLIGFERGYDLEIGMRALEAWEEIAGFPEPEAAELAHLHIGLLWAYDLSSPDRAVPFLVKIKKPFTTEAGFHSLFVRGALQQYHVSPGEPKEALACYRDFLAKTKSLDGYRVGTVLLGNLLAEPLKDPEAAIQVFSSLASTPPHLVATPSISLAKRQEVAEAEKRWGILGLKMAGYAAEYRLQNPDRARFAYQRAVEIQKSRRHAEPDSWLDSAMIRTEPKSSPAQILFDMAYEKYRSRDLKGALDGYETFIASYPDHPLWKEALFRTAVITDDDLKDFTTAYELYQRYLIKVVPRKSTWQLDTLYDWGRIDEIRYRMGLLLCLHQKDPVGALKAFEDLSKAYPESYWAQQGLKDSIRLIREEMSDPNLALERMQDFIDRYPESKDAQTFRKDLFEHYLGQREFPRALTLIRDYLDHADPSEEDFMDLKARWRDLSFRLHEEGIRKHLTECGIQDRIDLYHDLVDVMGLASTSQPLDALGKEIESADLPDADRWELLYYLGTAMFREYPGQAKDLFVRLADNASGPARLACHLTLGNIAYRVDKSVPDAISHYEAAASLTPLIDPMIETPLYRLGRLYLVSGEGEKALGTLTAFTRRFPRSRHLARAFLALGEAYAMLHHPVQAARFLRRVPRLSPSLAEKARKHLEEIEGALTPEEWLAEQVMERESQRVLAAASASAGVGSTTVPLGERMATGMGRVPRTGLGSETVAGLETLPVEELYERHRRETIKPKPDPKLAVMLVHLILRKGAPPALEAKALRHYLSWRFWRSRQAEEFVTEAQELLTARNYAAELSDVLYRMSQAKELFTKDFVGANKSYFEYLSFFPQGKRILAVRERIPRVYEKAGDKKNALRFYTKLIEDSALPAGSRVDASLDKSRMEEKGGEKNEAVKTLEAALAFESPRQVEILLRLERITEEFSYIERAIAAPGEEKFRFQALKRLIRKAEKDKDFAKAGGFLEQFAKGFIEPDSQIWIEKKTGELANRGSIAEVENLIEQFPEEPETPARLFKLAQMVEGTEDTKYRSQDLFYEITLVYPHSEFFRESKIRAENARQINSIQQLSLLLKKGTKGNDGAEALLERSRLHRESLQDPVRAIEDLETLLKLYPDSRFIDEACLGLGDLALSQDRNPAKALEYWEQGLSASRDHRLRETLTRRITDLRTFHEKVLYSEKRDDHDEGEQLIFRIWRMDGDPDYALRLLEETLEKLENRPHAARLNYLAGRILEAQSKPDAALVRYEKALRSLYHPGCRKDRILFRMARIQAGRQKVVEAEPLYRALVNRYPRSLLSRSALYWLYRRERDQEHLTVAHDLLTRLLNFRSLIPSHRTELLKQEKELASRMNIKELERLQGYAKAGATEFPYYIGKVMENEMRDPDRAIEQYEKYLRTHPAESRSRALIFKIAGLYETKGDFVKAVSWLDQYLRTLEAKPQNLDLIVRIGALVEDRLGKPDLATSFYESLLDDYKRVGEVKTFLTGKLRLIERKRLEKPAKARVARKAVRTYSEEDEELLDELKDIKEKQIDDMQDFIQAERLMLELWDANPDSPVTLDLMKELVALNENQLMDPQKAAEFYERWLSENPDDQEYGFYTMKLYDLYMEKVKDGQKALRLLTDYVQAYPSSQLAMEAELKVGKANEELIRNWDEARRAYQRLIDTRRNDPIVHEAYFRMGFVLREGFADYTNAIRLWQEMNDLFYNNEFAADAQFAIAYTYEAYVRDYTKARENFEKLLNLYPNSPLQNQVRESLLRIGGKK